MRVGILPFVMKPFDIYQWNKRCVCGLKLCPQYTNATKATEGAGSEALSKTIPDSSSYGLFSCILTHYQSFLSNCSISSLLLKANMKHPHSKYHDILNVFWEPIRESYHQNKSESHVSAVPLQVEHKSVRSNEVWELVTNPFLGHAALGLTAEGETSPPGQHLHCSLDPQRYCRGVTVPDMQAMGSNISLQMNLGNISNLFKSFRISTFPFSFLFQWSRLGRTLAHTGGW